MLLLIQQRFIHYSSFIHFLTLSLSVLIQLRFWWEIPIQLVVISRPFQPTIQQKAISGVLSAIHLQASQ